MSAAFRPGEGPAFRPRLLKKRYRSIQRLRHKLQSVRGRHTSRPGGRGGFICLHESLMPDYPGSVASWILVWRHRGRHLELLLRHSFVCYGIDFFGDDFYAEHDYAFGADLRSLLGHVQRRTGLKVGQFQQIYPYGTPSPMHASKEELVAWRAHWDRLEADFRSNRFLDPTLKLVSSYTP